VFVSPVFLILCLIMFWVFYQKGLKFFLALGHKKWRCHVEGALVGLLVGFGFPLAVILYGTGERKPAAPGPAVNAPQAPGPAAGSPVQEPVGVTFR
jgi:hypothetical protein